MATSSKATLKMFKSPRAGPKPMACCECKKQKIYCSKEHPKCERCQLRSIECVYAGPKKIRINEHNLKSLKAKLQRYEEILRSLSPSTIASFTEHTFSGVSLAQSIGAEERAEEDELAEEEDDAEDESLPDQFKQMSLYLRTSRGSADNFFRTARTVSGVCGDDGGLEQNSEFYDPRALPLRRRRSNGNISLPPVDIARQYFAAQHMYIGTIFAFTDADTFERQLKEMYNSDILLSSLDATASLVYAKFLTILALGRLYSVNQRVNNRNNVTKDDPPGFELFSHALSLLPDIHEECSILGVETLAYVGYFMQNMNRRDAAFLYIGVALRMAINLGLHQEAQETSGLNETDREHRRRVWWSIYSLDRILSLKSGNPISILDEDISAKMPSRLPGEADDSPVVVLRHYTELSRILGEITSLIYRRTAHTGQSLTTAVHSIFSSLTRWEDTLPKSLRLELDWGKLSRESISTFLHYYQCINMTARPLLFHIVQKRLKSIRESEFDGAVEKERDWRTGLSKKTVAIISGCISAARNTLLIMSKAAEYNLIATFGYMDSEHAISAVIVLVMVCGSFPNDPNNTDSLTKGLSLLRNIGQLGNSYVAARFKLLTHLWSILSRPINQIPINKSFMFATAEQEASQSTMNGIMGVTADASGVARYFDPGRLNQYGEMSGALQQHGESEAGISRFTDQAYFKFGGAGTLGLLSNSYTEYLIEDADSHLWTKAFANPVGFNISQLIPDADVTNYGML